jgi:hypothetical protein
LIEVDGSDFFVLDYDAWSVQFILMANNVFNNLDDCGMEIKK